MIDRDVVAFDAFYQEQRPALIRLAVLLTGSVVIAEDLAQEALLATHRRWVDLENRPGYARRALVNLVHSHHRRRVIERRHQRGSHLDHVLPPEIDETWNAIRSLSTSQRAVLVLRFYEDLTINEIAELLDKPPGTVKSLIHRALAHLKEVLR